MSSPPPLVPTPRMFLPSPRWAGATCSSEKQCTSISAKRSRLGALASTLTASFPLLPHVERTLVKDFLVSLSQFPLSNETGWLHCAVIALLVLLAVYCIDCFQIAVAVYRFSPPHPPPGFLSLLCLYIIRLRKPGNVYHLVDAQSVHDTHCNVHAHKRTGSST